MFSSKNLRILLEVFGFRIESSGSGFGRGYLPTDPKVSSYVGGDLPPIDGVVNSGGFRFGFGRVAQVGRVSGLGGRPNCSMQAFSTIS